MWTICLKKKKNNPSQSKKLATLEDIHMGRSGRSNKQVYMFCIDIDPVGESNKWASYLNFACSLLACSYYWIFYRVANNVAHVLAGWSLHNKPLSMLLCRTPDLFPLYLLLSVCFLR